MAITPDTKDWTWVLDRPCPECGFDASGIVVADIAPSIRTSTASWVRALARDGAATRTVDDRWSVLEYGCHVRDVFRVYLERLDLMLTQGSPTFADWDQNEAAAANQYGSQDPSRVAVDLEEGGTALANRFDTVRGDEWQREGTRSNGSHFTVETIGIYMIHDPIHHLWDIAP